MQKSTNRTRVLTGTAMLGAVAALLMYLEFPIPIMPAFIKLDVSELPALLASFAYGPVSGIVVCLIKNLIKLPSTSTARAPSSAPRWARWLWRWCRCRTTILSCIRRM